MRVRIVAPLAIGAALTIAVASPSTASVSMSPASSSSATGPVLNAVASGGRLYIGGSFTQVDGVAHAGLAALNAATGLRDAGFSTQVTGTVNALATDGTNVYIGGSFTAVGGVPRTNVAALAPSGQVLSGFAPSVSSSVTSLDYANGALYIGGDFATVNGLRRPKLAALNPVTGAVVAGFNPKPNGLVHVVKASGGQVYVGGKFTTIGGVARNYVALLDAAGSVQPYNAKLGFDSQVTDIATSGTAVFLVTGGHLPAGNSVYATAAGTGAQRWQVKTDGNVQTVEVVGGEVFAGGHFNNVCLPPSDGVTRCLIDFASRKAVITDADTGQSRPLATFNSAFGVWDLTAAGGNLYALGEFTRVNGLARGGIARFPIQ